MNVTPPKKMCQARYLTPHNDHGFSVFVIPDQRAIASAEPESSTTAKTQSVLFLIFKGKRLRLFTVALDTGSAFANAHLSGMTMYRNTRPLCHPPQQPLGAQGDVGVGFHALWVQNKMMAFLQKILHRAVGVVVFPSGFARWDVGHVL